jgi:nucleotide-binding universal stress UspA family protein
MSEQERTPNQRRDSSPERSQREPVIRRIVVALDATPQSAALLEAAADLAQSLETELVGLFVEDINLLRLSELPFASEIGSFSTARRPVQAMHLERQLRAQAVQLRRMLMRAAERRGVPWHFQVARGAIVAELRKAAAETDLFILGRSAHTRGGRSRLGSTARALLIQAPRLTLVLHRETQWKQPVLVAYDGSEAAQRALRLAARLTRNEDAPLIVILVSDDRDEARELQEETAGWLQLRGLRARYQWLARANITRLVNLVIAERGGAFVLPCDGIAVQEAALLALLEELQCPVLLVR